MTKVGDEIRPKDKKNRDPIKSEEKEVSNLPPSVRKERAMLMLKKTITKYYRIVMGLINAKF